MTKKIKNILQDAYITVKWFNINHWQKEEYNNLLEMVEEEGIIITRNRREGMTSRQLIVTWRFGSQVIKEYTTDINIERTLYTMLVQRCIYLGDRFKVQTRYRDWSF